MVFHISGVARELPAGCDAVFCDDFEDNTKALSWEVGAVEGTSVSETDGALQILHEPAPPGTRSGGYQHRCKLRGDFDLQVDYSLIEWPRASETKVGLWIFPGRVQRSRTWSGTMERSSRPFLDCKYCGEKYIVQNGSSTEGRTRFTTDLKGKLRLARANAIVTGQYFSSGAWISLGTFTLTSDIDVNFGISSWGVRSEDYQPGIVTIEFDNFMVERGRTGLPVRGTSARHEHQDRTHRCLRSDP